MRIAVVGATGRIGRLTIEALERDGHETVGISRAQGVDVHSGDGLAPAPAVVDAVIDAVSSPATDHDEAVEFFSRSARNLLEAERQAGAIAPLLVQPGAPADVLLPGPDARIAPTTFDDWLAAQ